MLGPLLFATVAVRGNCFSDYVATVGESCFFGSDNSRLAFALAYDVFVEGCDFESCECANPRLEATHCDSFVVKTMTQFMGLHPHTGAPERSLYRNVTDILRHTCDQVSPNEAPVSQLEGSVGACNPSGKPTSGHTAGITLYTTLVSIVFTYTFLGGLGNGGKTERHGSPNGKYTRVALQSESANLLDKLG